MTVLIQRVYQIYFMIPFIDPAADWWIILESMPQTQLHLDTNLCVSYQYCRTLKKLNNCIQNTNAVCNSWQNSVQDKIQSQKKSENFFFSCISFSFSDNFFSKKIFFWQFCLFVCLFLFGFFVLFCFVFLFFLAGKIFLWKTLKNNFLLEKIFI